MKLWLAVLLPEVGSYRVRASLRKRIDAVAVQPQQAGGELPEIVSVRPDGKPSRAAQCVRGLLLERRQFAFRRHDADVLQP